MIPVYRAKEINSGELIEGCKGQLWCPLKVGWVDSIIVYAGIGSSKHFKINIKTLAIHFPNMISKNGKKIFASLNKYGIGGDRLNIKHIYIDKDTLDTTSKLLEAIAIFKEQFAELCPIENIGSNYPLDSWNKELEVIGIHEETK